MTENLGGMTSEQLLLRDLIYEIPEILEEADEEGDPMYRLGGRVVAYRLEEKLKNFGIDQSRFARQMPDVDAWFLGQKA